MFSLKIYFETNLFHECIEINNSFMNRMKCGRVKIKGGFSNNYLLYNNYKDFTKLSP
jgi:hypothetical protein